MAGGLAEEGEEVGKLMNTITLPGLIDPHVHLRDPGQTEKEDFYTGTSAALAGGYLCILDMPNNKTPITTFEKLEEKISIARKKIVCNVGFYFGSAGDNLDEFEKAKDKVFGLKLYLNPTTGNLLIDNKKLENIFNAWKKVTDKPILVHAEEKKVEDVINMVKKTEVKTHFCHVSKKDVLNLIITAKESGLPITCGVTPHHLFLSENNAKRLGPFGQMKPSLSSKKDQEYLWKNLRYIDIVESDHAPHTIDEKRGEGTAFGVPGLETTLPLLLTAVNDNRLTIDEIIRLCSENPSRIFGVGKNCDGKIEVNLNKSYTIDNKNLFTKCGWSPFEGWKLKEK